MVKDIMQPETSTNALLKYSVIVVVLGTNVQVPIGRKFLSNKILKESLVLIREYE